MRRPTNFEFTLVHYWLEHAALWWVWNRLYELVRNDATRAWKVVQVMVAYTPTETILAHVAAGPVEDLMMHASLLPEMLREAETNARFRICLGMAYGLPEELKPFIDRETKIESVPTNAVEGTAEEISLMVNWFQNAATSWAPRLFEEMSKNEPEDALFILRMLLASDKHPHLRETVFDEAFGTFVQKNLATYREHLTALVREHQDLRRWCVGLDRAPTDDEEDWTVFVREL